MSGFFAVRLDALDLSTLRPCGYKVLLEIIAQSRLRSTAGVPFSFQPRFTGQSKASVAQGMRFLVQLVALRLGMSMARLAQFAAFLVVGLSGVAVNTFALWGLSAAWFQLPYLLGSFVATNIAIVWNFVLLETWVFRRVRRRSFAAGFARFWLVNAVLLPVQLGLLAVLVEGPGLNPVIANVITLVVVFFLRYLLTSRWVYGRNAAPADVLVIPPRQLMGPPLSTGARSTSEMPGASDVARGGRRPPIGSGIALLRLAMPVAATLLAFPQTAALCWQLLRSGGLEALCLLAGWLAGGTIMALNAAPVPGEPDVHDRQLDVILAAPFLAAAIWLSLGWSSRLGLGHTWSTQEVLATTAFLAGASFLLLGTRLTARIRGALCWPLLALPVIAGRPALLAALIAVVLIATGRSAIRRLRTRRRSAGDTRRSAMPPPLPSWQVAGSVVGALALMLAVISIAPGTASDGARAADPHPAATGHVP